MSRGSASSVTTPVPVDGARRSTAVRRRRLSTPLLGLVLALGLHPCPGSAHAQSSVGDDLAPALREDLEAVLSERLSDLADEKDADGNRYRRGSYSKSFRKTADGGYEVSFEKDTAGKDRVKTERFVLTLAKNPSGKWSIAKEQLEDTYEGLRRGVIGDEAFYRFDAMIFEREGLRVSAKNGSLYKDFLDGKTSRFIVFAPDLKYEYAPPKGVLNYYELYNQVMMKEYPERFRIEPDYAGIECVPRSCDELESAIFTGLRKVALDQTDSELQKFYGDVVKKHDKLIKEEPFAGFRRLPEEENRAYSIRLVRQGIDDAMVGLSYDNEDPREVTFFTSKTGAVFEYNSEDTRNSGASPYDLEQRIDAHARDYDLVGLLGTVDLALEDAGSLSGDVTYKMKIKRDLRELPFFIARLRFPGREKAETKSPRLFINSIRDGAGNELTYAKLGAFGGLVVFPETIRAGAEISVRLQFTNLDSLYKLDPYYSYLSRGGWLPFVRFTDRIDEFDLTVRVPERYTVLGVGRKVSETREGGRAISHWVAESAVSFPTIILGDYVSDKPAIEARKSDGTPIPVNIYVDKGSLVDWDIRPKQLGPKADEAVNALNLYREIFGVDYPYGKLDLVNDPLGFLYGQSPASIIYLGSGVFRGEGTLAMFGGAQLSRFLKEVVPHEVAHQWWGSLISNANDRNYWWVESLAEYSSALFVENVNGKEGRKKYLDKVAEWRRDILRFEELSSVQDASVVWGGEFPGAAYTANVYNKGPYAFHILREMYGDEKFFRFLKTLATGLKGRSIVTRDIERVMNEGYGGTLDWFFDQWIRGVGLPQYAVSYQVHKTEDGKYLVEGTIRQRVVAGKGMTEMPGVYYRASAPFTCLAAGGKEMRSKPLVVEGPETPFKFKTPLEPVQVIFNKDGEILAQDVLSNTGW
jgi:hypothetical protein